MNFAILFSYHVNASTCLSRIRTLRRLNPGVSIHGLFTGGVGTNSQFLEVATLLESNYRHPVAPAAWLWQNYDKVICRWFLDCGHALEWDFLFVHAWDLVVLAPLRSYLEGMTQEEVFVPGVRPLERMDEDIVDPREEPVNPGNWSWVRLGSENLSSFQNYCLSSFGQKPALFCEVSPFAVLSREFCVRYSAVAEPIPGFTEYRFPTLVPLLGFRFAERTQSADFWRYFNAAKKPISLHSIESEAARIDGARLFHPVYETLSETLVSPAWSLDRPEVTDGCFSTV